MCFKSMTCLLPSWCYCTKVCRILSCLFYWSTTMSMSTQSLFVKLGGLSRRLRHVAQRAVDWAKNLCMCTWEHVLACLKLLSDMFCHVECWSLSLAHLSCTVVAWNMLENDGDTIQKTSAWKTETSAGGSGDRNFILIFIVQFIYFSSGFSSHLCGWHERHKIPIMRSIQYLNPLLSLLFMKPSFLLQFAPNN